jgi:alkaline phosphatase D
MKSRLFFLLTMFVSVHIHGQEKMDRIAFGSCSAHFGKQRIWKSVVDKDPDLWIWLGDNIYADTEDMEKMAYRYAQLDTNENYNLLKQSVPIIATWDDHDFGGNDVGKNYPKKAESQQLFLRFFNEPKNSKRWKQQGVYASYTYGSDERKVKVILLDTRYNRDDPGSEADMLGEEQWQWLESEMRSNDAKITIIGSSIQFVNAFKGFECWSKFPTSQKRILDLVAATKLKGVFFISGDVHFGEVSKRQYPQVSYPIYDFTSSGLTHGNQIVGFKNPDRVTPRWGFRNFATIEFDWEKQEVVMLLHDMLGTRVFKQDVPFTELGY